MARLAADVPCPGTHQQHPICQQVGHSRTLKCGPQCFGNQKSTLSVGRGNLQNECCAQQGPSCPVSTAPTTLPSLLGLCLAPSEGQVSSWGVFAPSGSYCSGLTDTVSLRSKTRLVLAPSGPCRLLPREGASTQTTDMHGPCSTCVQTASDSSSS